MIEKKVRKFLAIRHVSGDEGDENIITAGKIYIEIRPNSGIIRLEDSPILTYGLSLDLVKERGGIDKYFKELTSVPFRDTAYFTKYQEYWENDVHQKYMKIRKSLNKLNKFSQMVGKPQYGLRQVNAGSPNYEVLATHDFEVEGKKDETES